MVLDYIARIMTYFKNITLNSIGAERDIYAHLQDGDVQYVLDMMENNYIEVDKAIREYNPQLHDIMHRPNKFLDDGSVYHTEKLPRVRARYINEVELFFLLGNKVEWKQIEGSDEAYHLFMDFLKETHFDSHLRKAKRLAGAETESARVYHLWNDKGEIKVTPVVLARTLGYKLRPMFDQYGRMTAFAYGYKLKEGGRSREHWEIQTKEMIFRCVKADVGWKVESYENPTHKINALYYRQLKAWDGVQARLDREESLDSKQGDTNNYFADPIATATADVIDSMVDPNRPGKLIQLTNRESQFSYVNPPTASESLANERRNLQDSILFDTFTPDFSYENIKGFGSLSGAAIKNSMVLGFMKRSKNIEIYGELLEREISLIKEILKVLHPDKIKDIDELKMEAKFAEPFDTEPNAKWGSIINLYAGGLVSLEEAIKMLSLTNCPDEECDKIRMQEMEKIQTQLELQAEMQKQKEQGNEEE